MRFGLSLVGLYPNKPNYKKTAHSAKTILLYDCCTETYTDGHAVLMFVLFKNIFSLLALTFVAVTIFRPVYN